VLKKISDGSIQKSYGYRYDAAGNRTNETIGTIVSQDTHNNLNQILSRQGGTGILPVRGQADEAVSSVTVNGSAAVVRGQNFEGSASVTPGTNTVTVAATDLNSNTTTKQYQVTISGSGSATMSYDSKGNLLNDGTKTYEWDVLNRLTAINYTGTSPLQRTEFTYNGLGQRVKIVEKSGGSVVTEKRFIWIPSSPQPTEERDASNSVTRRFYAQGEQIAGNSYYYDRDHLGSVRDLVDSTGTLRARYDYDLYGRRSANMVTVNPVEADFGYTGHYWHANSALGLAFYRFYSADLGRWLNRDPLEEGGGMNLYRYVDNSPVSLLDRLGLAPYQPYDTPAQAAANALNDILALSIKENSEYSGAINVYKDGPYKGKYYYTPADTLGDPNHSEIPQNDCGWYHTHPPGNDAAGAEEFSRQDIKEADKMGEPAYIGTPSGRMKTYQPWPLDSKGRQRQPGGGTYSSTPPGYLNNK
jgi:RHS repeat-associated protein